MPTLKVGRMIFNSDKHEESVGGRGWISEGFVGVQDLPRRRGGGRKAGEGGDREDEMRKVEMGSGVAIDKAVDKGMGTLGDREDELGLGLAMAQAVGCCNRM